jgi:dihydropteroate synthase
MVNLPGLAGSPAAGRCLVMGVVNVTPDSFSDGGQWFGAGAAIEHGLELIAQGADIVDVGGESTRPGAQRIPADEELRRVKPVITELVRAGAVVSVDTMRAQVAEWAVEAGVSLVNDVSGGLADPYMPRLVAKAGVPYVVMHWRGHSHDMYSRAIYADVVREVHDELAQRIDAVTAEGVDPSMIVLDPGLGFSKNPAAWGPEAHNWQLLAGLRELATIGGRDFPVLVGASRKRYLSRLGYPPGGRPPVPPDVSAGGPDRKDRDLVSPARTDAGGEHRPYSENDDATAAITALVAAAGAWCVRVHHVPANADAVRVAAAYRAAARS